MLYVGLLAAVLGALLGPAWPMDLATWLHLRSIAILLLGLALVAAAQARPKVLVALLLFSSLLTWLAVHRRATAPGSVQMGKVIARHGEQFGAMIAVLSNGSLVTTFGRAKIGQLVEVRCRVNQNFFQREVCFSRSVAPDSPSSSKRVTYHISRYGPTISHWLHATLLGQNSAVSYEKKQAFKHSGLFHLIVVSGFHVSLVAALVKGLVLALAWVMNLPRLLTPRKWQLSMRWGGYLCVVFVWWFAWLTGLGCPAQRAAICYSLTFLGMKRNKVTWGLLLQAVLFPCGWLSLSNGMSWACYLVLLSIPGNSWGGFLRQVVFLSSLAWVLIGCFSPIGLVTNIIFAPWIAVLIITGLLIVLLPTGHFLVAGYRTAIIMTEDLLMALSDHSGYFETDLGWFRWFALCVVIAYIVANLRPCNVEQKLLS